MPNSILPSEARFAYVTFAFQFAEIYVPFVTSPAGSNGTDSCDLKCVPSSIDEPRQRVVPGRVVVAIFCGVTSHVVSQAKPPSTPAELNERAVRRRAVEAVILGMPAVNYERMLQAAIDNGQHVGHIAGQSQRNLCNLLRSDIHAAKQEKEKETFTAWGTEVDGLQAGLGYQPGHKRACSHGEIVRWLFGFPTPAGRKGVLNYISALTAPIAQ